MDETEPTFSNLQDDLPTESIMRLAEQGRAFNFWREKGEDIYTLKDGEPV